MSAAIRWAHEHCGELIDPHTACGLHAARISGLPAGVLNLVFGMPNDISTYLIGSPTIRKISFTGSIPVGKHLAKMAADGMKKATMELGGHSPVIVFDDVDPVKVADMAAAGKYRNAGQVCIAPTRFFVHESNYKKFAERFTEIASGMKLGNGLEASSQMGPLANAVPMTEPRLVADSSRS